MRDHPIVEKLLRDGYPEDNSCDRCGYKAIFFADDGRKLCEDCAENMIFALSTKQVMRYMGWDLEIA